MVSTLTGSNSFLLDLELKKLERAFINEHSDIGLEKFDGEETTAERMIEAAQSLPFLAPKKLVILKNPGAQKAFAEQIEQVIKAVPETTALIIVEPKVDKRSAYFKVLKAKTEFKEFTEQDAYGLSNWIVQYAKEQAGSINPADARYLIERVGQNQQMLANELDKLLSYKPKIDRESTDLLTEKSPQSTIFELLDAAFAGNAKLVDKLYKEQRALKVEPQQIIAMLAWQLHVLALVKTAGDKSADQIVKEAGINPFVVRKTQSAARNVSLADTKKLVKKVLSLDVRLKTESIDADEALMHLLLTLGNSR